MNGTITAIYEGGVLRPLRPLVLPEHTRVQLRVVKQTPAAEPDRERTTQALLSTGRVKRLEVTLVEDIGLRSERQAPPTVPGISLSDTIIAQRAEGLATEDPNFHT